MSQQLIQSDQLSSDGSSSPVRDLSRPVILAGLLILAGMLWPIAAGRIHTSDDLWKYHFPIRKFYADCLSRGDSFDWMPSVFCGYFLTGTGQAGTYHPWHWALYKFLPLNAAFTLEITASYPFMLLGMRLFLLRWLKRSDSAWLGAIVFALSGFCLLHFLHPNAIAVIAHLPWLLSFIDQVLRRGSTADSRSNIGRGISSRRLGGSIASWRAEMAIALLTGSQLLLGYPQYVWYSLLAESVYCLVVAFRKQPNRKAIRLLYLLAGLKLVGAGLGAVQVLPSIAALHESDRTHVSPIELNQHPLHPTDMLQWFAPYLTSTRVFGKNTHELAVYCGAIPFLLALLAMHRRGVDRTVRTLQLATLALGLVALWLSFGADAGLYAVQMKLPLIGKFRWPSRIVVLLHFCVAILAAMAFDKAASQAPPDPLKKDREATRVRWTLIVVPVLSIIASAASVWLLSPDLAGPRGLLIAGPLLATLAAVMVFDLLRGRCSAGFMLFLIADLAVYGFTYEPLHKTESAVAAMQQIEQPPGVAGEGRMLSQRRDANGGVFYLGNQATLHGWELADGYEGLMPRVHFLERELTLDSLRIAGVRWVPNDGIYQSIQGLQKSADSNWLEIPNPLPVLHMTSKVQFLFTRSDLRRAGNVSPLMNPQPHHQGIDIPRSPETSVHPASRIVPANADVAVELDADGPTMVDPNTGSPGEQTLLSALTSETTKVPSEIASTTLPQSDDGSPGVLNPGDHIEVLQNAPGQLRARVTTDGVRLLVWNQRYSAGWVASVDGDQRPAIRANLDFLATTIPEGTHTVEFHFQPPSLLMGLNITLASLLLLLMWTTFRRWRSTALLAV